MGLYRTDTGQVIDAGGVTPKGLGARAFRGPRLKGLTLSPQLSPVSVTPPLIPDRPRESDTSLKEAQVG